MDCEESQIKIFIVDDHPVFRTGLAQVLSQEPDLIVVGQAQDARGAIEGVERLKPDLILLDLNLPDKSGLETMKELREGHPELLVLVLSVHDEMFYAERALGAGAAGYIMKDAGSGTIIKAIRQVLQNQSYVSSDMAARIVNSLSANGRKNSSPFSKLTDREFEIFRLIGEGQDNHVISTQLGISTKTIDVHRANIRGKLKLKTGIDLICYAIRWVESEHTLGNLGNRHPLPAREQAKEP